MDSRSHQVAEVADLVGIPDDLSFEDLRSWYSQVRRFLPALQEAVEFAATDAGCPVIEAFGFLKAIEGQKGPDVRQEPQALLTAAWKRVVIGGAYRPPTLHILEGLLQQPTDLRPHENMSDTAGRSDLVFGVLWPLCYQFSHQLADFGHARFLRMDPKANYDALDGVARQRINIPRIERNWDDLLQVASSLKMGAVSTRRAREPARGAGSVGQRGGASEHPLSGSGTGPSPRDRRHRQAVGCRTALAAAAQPR